MKLNSEKKKYCQFNRVDDNLTELYIYGDIRKPDIVDKWFGDDETRVDAYSFKEALENVDTPNLLVRINSDGGSVAEGLAIYSLLCDFKGHLTTKVDGWACSAASVIFMAGEKRIMPESALLMIHNAWTQAVGDPNELRKAADDLAIVTQPSVNIYVSKTGLSEQEIKKMMDEETWMDNRTAFEKGFATHIEKDSEEQQSVSCMRTSIKKLLNRISILEENQKEKNEEIKEEIDAWASFFNERK